MLMYKVYQLDEAPIRMGVFPEEDWLCSGCV